MCMSRRQSGFEGEWRLTARGLIIGGRREAEQMKLGSMDFPVIRWSDWSFQTRFREMER